MLGKIIFIIGMSLYLAVLGYAAYELPERVASHFGASGVADGWMARSEFLLFAAGLMLLPIAILAIFYAVPWLPRGLINIPNAHYWKSDAHWSLACRKLRDLGFYSSGCLLAFLAFVNFLVVRANLLETPHIPSWLLFASIPLLLAVLLVPIFRTFALPKNLLLLLCLALATATAAAAPTKTVPLKIEMDGNKIAVSIMQNGDDYLLFVNSGNSPGLYSPDAFARHLYDTHAERNWLSTIFNISTPWGMAWVSIGLLGQLIFAARMLVQWLASEKSNRSIIPVAFWWMSLVGASMLLAYFIWRRDIVGIAGQAIGWLIYLRNLSLIHRKKNNLP